MTMNALPPSSDQILVFLAVVDQGSFSAAARHLSRAQSAITYSIQKLEADLGVSLFDRTGQRPVLTGEGAALLGNARRISHEIGAIQRRAQSLIRGEEGEVTLVVEAMFPMQRLLAAIKESSAAFPAVTLRIFVESLGAAVEKLLDRTCTIGISGPIAFGMNDLRSELIGTIRRIPVAAPSHPLAQWEGEVPLDVMSDYPQLVTTDRSRLTEGQNFGVLSPATWRLSDLGAKHDMIRAGLGWGSLPHHMVEQDLAEGRLVRLRPAEFGVSHWASDFPIYLAHRADADLGPATRHLLDGLRRSMAV